ncbi:hypothetical protein [Clostridium sp. DL1XJH146]
MIFTKALDYEDIKVNLNKEEDIITIIGCETCVRVAGSGGQEKMKELALQLRKDGYNVKDGFMVPSACTPKVLFAKLSKDVNTIISLACGAGTANIGRSFEGYKIIESVEDIGLMVTDTKKEIIKITMPFKKDSCEVGKEYEVITGNKNDSDNGLPIMEVVK